MSCEVAPLAAHSINRLPLRTFAISGSLSMPASANHCYFLGGYDLEMAAIRELLDRHVPSGAIHDRHLAWGACVRDYVGELDECLKSEQTPVLIELSGADDWRAEHQGRALIVDHHDSRAGRDQPSSLRQVFDLLGRPQSEWTRWLALVDANDRGHAKAMRQIGASLEEMLEVRARDRAAQGVTSIEEAQAHEAINSAHTYLDGRLTVVEIPHDRTAPVTDVLDPLLGGAGYENLLVIGRKGRYFFGRGWIVELLLGRFGGWKGGQLPDWGYWGVTQTLPLDELRACIAEASDRATE